MVFGLWQTAFRSFTVPIEGGIEYRVGPIDIEAWRDNAAEDFGYYHTCD